MDISVETCGNVDEFTKGVCYLAKDHKWSHEVRFGYKPDNRFIEDEIDLSFAEAANALRELGISDIAARNDLFSAKYGKYVEKTHAVRGNSVIWVKVVYLSQNDTFWLYAQNVAMSV